MLRNLARSSNAAHVIAAVTGSLASLVQLLSSSSADVQEAAAEVLRNLARSSKLHM